MMGVIGLMMLASVVWSAVFLLNQTAIKGQRLGQVKSMAQSMANSVRILIKQQTDLIQGFARQSQAVDLYELGDPQRLQAEQERLTALVPDALLVRLLSPQLSVPDTRLTPNMGYASLQLLRQAENSDQPSAAELHQFGTPHQHIAIVAAVRDQAGDVQGVLHAAYSTQMLGKLLDSFDSLKGHVEWQQVIPGKSALVIAEKGSVTSSQRAPDGVFPIPGTIWQIAYWGDSDIVLEPIDIAFQAVPGLLLVILAALLMLMLSKLMAGALKKDQHSILSLVEALVVGRPPKKQFARLSDLQPTLDVMEHQIREYRTRQIEKSKIQQATVVQEVVASSIDVDEGVAELSHASTVVAQVKSVEIDPSIFRAYDIRGIVGKTLTEEVVALLGQGFGSDVFEQGYNNVVVARDARRSSEHLQRALIEGLQASGRNIIDLGMVPTPLLHYAVHELDAECGVMITGSHNPLQYNGLKLIVGNESPTADAIQDLRRRIDADQLLRGEGSFDTQNIVDNYIERILSDVRMGQTLKVVVDCANAAASVVAPELYRQLGCEVIELYCDVDGDFPNHHPDPGDPNNMRDLQSAVVAHEAALGLAFDGDGDRLGVVDSAGKIIWPDRLLMYLAIDILTREPGGDIIYDVKCSRHLASIVLSNGGRPLMWKSGHSMLKAKMKETHALLAGEFSGHIVFSERWYGFDDGVYAGARLLEILSLDYRTSSEIFSELPESLSTPEYVLRLEEGQAGSVMEAIDQLPDLPGARMVRIDGLRAEFEKGWGLVRASNTIPALVFRFEAETQEDLEHVQSEFRGILKKIDPKLQAPF
jgi:phosphomannomutase/phosphoglucomutase